MPRARLLSASLAAGADGLILPWLAPRAWGGCAGSPGRRRRDGTSATGEQQCRGGAGRGTCAASSSTAPLNTPSRRNTRPTLDLRYADISAFARQQTRCYAAFPEAQSPHDASTRYSRRQSWKDQVDQVHHEVDGLDFAAIGRRRANLIAQTVGRLNSHAHRLQRDRLRYKNKLLYDGQYRSLQRLLYNLKHWDQSVVNVTKFSRAHVDDEHWLLKTFAALDRTAYARLNALTKPVTIEHDPRCQSFAEELLEGVERDGPGRIWMNWYIFQYKQRYYETTLVYLLDHHPGYAQDLIMVLALDNELPRSKFTVLADALAYLAKLHLKEQYPAGQGWEDTPAANIRKFVTTFISCTERVDTAAFSQDLLYSLVLLADTADLKRVYDALIESKTRLSISTVLHYVTAFAEAGEISYALQCLERRLQQFQKMEREAFVASDHCRWICAAVLRSSTRKAKCYHETPGIVAKFVELGVKMDLLLYDVIMHNAMDAGDFATAFKVFNTLGDNGMEADKYTFSILLHGCATQGDPTIFKAFADFCLKKAKELEDPWLATDYLYYIYVCEQSKPVERRDNSLMWRTYLDLFDMAPLKPFVRFGSRAMRDGIDQDNADPEKKRLTPVEQKLAPTEQALYLMLQTEIQQTHPLSPPFLSRLYQTFKRTITSTSDPALQSLARHPIIWNAFLHAFCAKQQYASASSLIKDMSAHDTPANVYSWNMFMQAFFKSSQVDAAERIFAHMRDRGVDPDAYTYGVMVRGYAKAQLVERIGDVMPHISEDDQLAPDLLRALANVQRRADLMATLEQGRVEKQQRDAEAKAKREKEEEDRFKIPGLKSLFAKAVTFREPTHWDHGSLEEADDFLEPDDEAVVGEDEAVADEYEAVEADEAVAGEDEAVAGEEKDERSEASADPAQRTYKDEDEYLEPDDDPNVGLENKRGTG